MGFIKEKKISVINTSLFHIGCAYFVQCNELGGSWFTGILCNVTEEGLYLTMGDGETRCIKVNELEDPKKGYKITLLVPGHDEVVDMAKHQDPIGFGRYMKEL